MNATNSTQTSPKIWVIFQGDNGKKLVDRLTKKFHKVANTKNIYFHFTSFHTDNAEGTVYQRVQQDAAECVAAIAIITHDDRDASEAGNLWFEIGLWLAQRPADLLTICRMKKAKLDSKHEQLISDINGKVVPPFTNIDQLWNHISEFVTNLTRKKNNQPTSRIKINDIFGKQNTSMWLSEKSYQCHSSNSEVCNFREQFFEFSAELLRMGKVNREREILALIISKISIYSGMYRDEIEKNLVPPQDHIPLTDNRRKILEDLSDALEKIKVFDKNALERKSDYYSDQLGSLERVSKFLTYRMESCRKVFEDFRPYIEITESEDELESLINQGIKEFIEFVSLYGGNRQRIKTDALQGKFCKDIIDLSYHTEKLARLLYALGEIYFAKCSRVLNGGFEKMTEPEIFHTRIKEIISALPHNDPKENHQSIWNKSIIPQEGTE